jgi:hypothetical protein
MLANPNHKQKGQTVKALNPTLERLEERITPDLLGSVTGTIGVIIGANAGAGAGGGTSACTNSASGGACSTHDTHSGTCHCDRHSC